MKGHLIILTCLLNAAFSYTLDDDECRGLGDAMAQWEQACIGAHFNPLATTRPGVSDYVSCMCSDVGFGFYWTTRYEYEVCRGVTAYTGPYDLSSKVCNFQATNGELALQETWTAPSDRAGAGGDGETETTAQAPQTLATPSLASFTSGIATDTDSSNDSETSGSVTADSSASDSVATDSSDPDSSTISDSAASSGPSSGSSSASSKVSSATSAGAKSGTSSTGASNGGSTSGASSASSSASTASKSSKGNAGFSKVVSPMVLILQFMLLI